ncbi:MAG: hypothetical protein PHW24_05190 [Candidatus Moranbacteria bacterium]|nr:hypothetical protein [Candidatus Moranbacteria bacterium]
MDDILTVAIIIAITAFFKKQLGLSGWRVILAAFIVSLILGMIPIIGATFPVIAPWLAALTKVIVLFLGAAGTVDFIGVLRETKIPPSG